MWIHLKARAVKPRQPETKRVENAHAVIWQVTLPPKTSITAIKYGHQSPKGSPQSVRLCDMGFSSISHTFLCVVHRRLSACAMVGQGEDKICCGNRDFATHPCKPASCPISSGSGLDYLPAMPFHAAIVDGKCRCFAPQVCDE